MRAVRNPFSRRPEGRRDLRRVDHARRGVVALVVIALLLGAAYLRSTGVVGAPPEVSALVSNAGGALRAGSDVKMRGVIIGRVTSIDRSDVADARSVGTTVTAAPVRVRMTIAANDLGGVPADVVARILPASVFGTTYVDLVRPGSEQGSGRGAGSGTRNVASTTTASLRSGAIIPPDRSQGTLELQQALDDIDRLVKALGPARLSAAIGAAATALDGRGAKLGDTLDRLDAYLAKLEPQIPQLRTDVRTLASSLQVVDRVAPDLLDATDDGLVALRTVAAQKAALLAVITGGTRLTVDARRFLDQNRTALVGTLDDAAQILDAVYDNRIAALREANRTNIDLAELLPTAVKGGFVDVDGRLLLSPPGYYTAADRPRYDNGGRYSPLGRATAGSLYGEGSR